MHTRRRGNEQGNYPVTVELIRKMIDTAEGTLRSRPGISIVADHILTASRDRALILPGLAVALMRLELAAIEVKHLLWHGRKITVTYLARRPAKD